MYRYSSLDFASQPRLPLLLLAIMCTPAMLHTPLDAFLLVPVQTGGLAAPVSCCDPADIPACRWFGCTVGDPAGVATCNEIAGGANSTAGRSCTCLEGWEYSEATGCTSKIPRLVSIAHMVGLKRAVLSCDTLAVCFEYRH
jgi:hypothetical protein